MVCLCTPDYYTQTHKWCGLEFAAMRKLEGVRIPKDADFGSIIPVTIVRDPSVPPVMSGMKPIDFSGLMRVGRPTFCDGPEYNEALMFIVDRIIQVAEFLRKNDKVAGCDKFDLPKRSAFANRYRRKEKFPRFR
jgi:hypothetical protein